MYIEINNTDKRNSLIAAPFILALLAFFMLVLHAPILAMGLVSFAIVMYMVIWYV